MYQLRLEVFFPNPISFLCLSGGLIPYRHVLQISGNFAEAQSMEVLQRMRKQMGVAGGEECCSGLYGKAVVRHFHRWKY